MLKGIINYLINILITITSNNNNNDDKETLILEKR